MRETTNDQVVTAISGALHEALRGLNPADKEHVMDKTLTALESALGDPLTNTQDLGMALKRICLGADGAKEFFESIGVTPPKAATEVEGEEREYAFDVKMFATIRATATSEDEARQLVKDHIDSGEANFGAWPNGDPILASVTVDDDELPLLEIDGEAV